jgi:hypothetical protein
MNPNKKHTKEEMLLYASEQIKRNATMSMDGHPDEGKMAKRLADNTYLISDNHNVYVAYPLVGGKTHLIHIHSILI